MRVRCVASDDPVPPHRRLARLVRQVLGQQDLARRLKRVVRVLGQRTALFVGVPVLPDAVVGGLVRRRGVLSDSGLAPALLVVLARVGRGRQPVVPVYSRLVGWLSARRRRSTRRRHAPLKHGRAPARQVPG